MNNRKIIEEIVEYHKAISEISISFKDAPIVAGANQRLQALINSLESESSEGGCDIMKGEEK